jgi:type II secretory pathway pseudopilin PulG
MKNKQEAGFSYIDVMIAVVILLVGILALVSAITGAIFQTRGQEQQLNAKQIATSTMESIMSVKETDAARLGWSKVGNICVTTPCAVPQGIFQNGIQPVKTEPGADEVLGTADDTGTVMTGFTREIIIRDECDPDRPSYNCNPVGVMPVRIRSVEINVKYYVGAIQRNERLTTVLTNY